MDLQATPRAGVTTGTFIKTAHPQVVEVLGSTGLAFAVIDAEHAPFDRNTLDLLMLAARAAGLPLLVRIPDKAGPSILQVLDLGAAGLVVPHVNNAAEARAIVARARQDRCDVRARLGRARAVRSRRRHLFRGGLRSIADASGGDCDASQKIGLTGIRPAPYFQIGTRAFLVEHYIIRDKNTSLARLSCFC